jgi:hypothetical protein
MQSVLVAGEPIVLGGALIVDAAPGRPIRRTVETERN